MNKEFIKAISPTYSIPIREYLIDRENANQ